MKTYAKLSILVVLAIGAAYANWLYKPKVSEDIHYHAGFIVYVDGVRQDYSDYKYMNFTPCTEHAVKKSREEEQIEKAHLHDGVGDVVHVHRNGAKWGDLLKNINVNLPSETDILKQTIEPNSSVVIIIGLPVSTPEKVPIEHIKEVEAKSELCGSDK